jgi:hypothetical protein
MAEIIVTQPETAKTYYYNNRAFESPAIDRLLEDLESKRERELKMPP